MEVSGGAAAMVAGDNRAHYSKMHALLKQGSLLKVRIFEQRDEAAKWLGLPNELLEPPPDSFLAAGAAA